MFELIKITSEPLQPEELAQHLIRDDCGAVVTFIGTVRNTANDGNKVTQLDIRLADAQSEAKLVDIAREITRRWQIRFEDIAIHRRIGRLPVGTIALMVAIAAVHRQEAFAACSWVIDEIKKGKITLEKDISD